MIAVTRGPGLIGALLVGVSTAKALAAARELPLTPVDHLHGHVVASTLGERPIEPPFLCLVASGGHTFLARVEDPSAYATLGSTLDDAAGEAFDKGGRLLGLPYPGGPEMDRLSREGDPEAFAFPRSQPGDGLDFSFSGLKTALLYRVRDLGEEETGRAPRGPRRVVPARDRGRPARARAPGARAEGRARGSRSAAAWPRTRSCARGPRRCARSSASTCGCRRCRSAPTTPR